ncbi:adenosine receptor A3-like [Physella acuta]|uniref:adenosine receptor A3-like n=1 Tax=Physella acuta TaxID=109671 RepID=UPI0027DCBFD1|nr:adenosine receptor A3-like [Physella acuta]
MAHVSNNDERPLGSACDESSSTVASVYSTVARGYNCTTVASSYNCSSVATGYNSTSIATGYNSTTLASGYISTSVASGYNSTTVATGYTTSLLLTEPNPSDVIDDDHHSPTDLSFAVISLAASVFISLGNSMTLLAIWHNRHLQTTPNLYIGSLALADVLVGLMLFVQGISSMNIEGRFLEEIEYACLSLMSLLFVSVCASMFSTLLVSLDRYMYIIYSLHYARYVTKERSAIVILVTWVLAVLYGTVPLYTSNFHTGEGCMPTHIFSKVYMIMVHPCLFFTVSVVTFCLYVQVGRAALRQQKLIRDQKLATNKSELPGATKRFSQRNLRLLKLLMSVFGLFFLCWCPLLVIACIEYTVHVSHVALNVASLVAVLNSANNFLVLAAMNKEFRSEFRRLLSAVRHCSGCRNDQVHPAPTVSVVSSTNPG